MTLITVIIFYQTKLNKNLIYFFSTLIIILMGNFTNTFIHIIILLIIHKKNEPLIKYINVISIFIIAIYFVILYQLYNNGSCIFDNRHIFFTIDTKIYLPSMSERFYLSCTNLNQNGVYQQIDNSIIEIYNTGIYNFIIAFTILFIFAINFKDYIGIFLLSFLFQSGLFIPGNLSFLLLLSVILAHGGLSTLKFRKLLFFKVS